LDEEILALPLAGEPVAAPANRGELLLAGVQDAAALSALARRAREAFGHPQAISGYVFQWMEGQWRPWLPPREHPAYAPLKLLQLESQARDYLQQKRLLDELGRKIEEPLCLASFSAMEDERTGEPMSFTVWPEGLEMLLPRTDQVVFFQPDAAGESGRIVARAPWDRVQRVAGDLMEPAAIYPPRYLVRDFPSAERLAEFS
jgi:hypothetical protein